ncbi:MAG: substrate-binding domain-containing protein [Lachnospiraceae bacterium]|nr:substrate-binding domain-containing protein [Lachnospiraceae bacterium]MDD3614675.1 substrate-binding domain-containing protein [Lachnospiraceae bacterium]
MRKKLPVFIGISVMILLTVASIIYYNYITNSLKINELTKGMTYDRHYVMISLNASGQFWQEVYKSACETAENEGAYVELLGEDSSQNYTLVDYIEIAIAAKVDGIILEPEDTRNVQNAIDEASDAGIPVVTVLEDCSNCKRLSYVGVNSYQLGQKYGTAALPLLQEGENRVMVLLHEEEKDIASNLIFTQINSTLQEGLADNQTAVVNSQSISSQNIFDSEEIIRDMLMNASERPDVLICLNEADTERAYQAVVDFNLVGDVQIIGYYLSDTIISAIEKNNIPMSMVVDARELGSYGVEALEEYRNIGNVSDYFSVDLTSINQSNIMEYQNMEEDS